MKFQGALFLIALAAGLQQLTLAQDVTDCTAIAADLDTMPIDPVADPDLPVCEDERNVAQCCSVDYILARLNITEEDYLEGLREELRERFQGFESIVDRLRQYIEGDFLTGYFASIGDFSFLGGGNALVNNFISDLRDNIEFDPDDDDEEEEDDMEETSDSTGSGEESSDGGRGFNIRRFLRNVVSRFEDAAVEQFSQQSTEVGQCIRQVVEGHIEEQKMEEQAEALQQIRRVLAAIENLRSFLRNFTDDLAGFRPLQQCIDRIVELNTCGRCVATRPPFCRNVCWAIARACYSPFNDALEDQLEVLWEVVRRILDAATGALGDLNRNRGILDVDNSAIIQQIRTDCNLNFDLPVGQRQADNRDDDDDEESRRIPLIPDVIRTAARALRGGPFDYDDRRVRGPGICRRLATRRVRCWDGQRDRGVDIEEFDEDDIDSQVNNPVIDLDEDVLREQAASLGTPISAALNDPSFAQVAPQGLVIPEEGGGGSTDNGAGSVVFSLTLLTIALVAGVFIM